MLAKALIFHFVRLIDYYYFTGILFTCHFPQSAPEMLDYVFGNLSNKKK